MYKDPRTQTLQAENRQLQEALRRLKQDQAAHKGEVEQPQPQHEAKQFQRRYQSNSQRISELQTYAKAQEETIREYKTRIQQFQQNLANVMKLDKDIHARLVNPQNNGALEANVRNVLLALNGKAPYDKLITMIEAIKI